MRWFGTVRARTGVVVDNLLLYVTGGFAYARFNNVLTVFEDAPATAVAFANSRTRWGWTAGVGTEWAFAPNWSLKSGSINALKHDDQKRHRRDINSRLRRAGAHYTVQHRDELGSHVSD